jgi:iron complex transport system permease protein
MQNYIKLILLSSLLLILGLSPIFNSYSELSQSVSALRIHRWVNAFIAGSCLSFSGLIFQIITKNSLADPFIMGTAPASILGLVIGTLVGTSIGYYFDIIFAIAISFLASALFLFQKSKSQVLSLISGVLMGGICLSITNLLVYIYPDNTRILTVLTSIYSNLENNNINFASYIVIICSIMAVILDTIIRNRVIAMQVGDNKSLTLGVSLYSIRFYLAILASIATCAVTTTFGLIGFVGFIAPNVIRLILGFNTRWIFSISILLGGLFLTAADALGRLSVPPYGVPVGLITPLLGVPIFLYLLFKKQLTVHE